eukprot:COSAG06_NODE_30012_length_546_cov_1.221477_1_plen_84_part_01
MIYICIYYNSLAYRELTKTRVAGVVIHKVMLGVVAADQSPAWVCTRTQLVRTMQRVRVEENRVAWLELAVQTLASGSLRKLHTL